MKNIKLIKSICCYCILTTVFAFSVANSKNNDSINAGKSLLQKASIDKLFKQLKQATIKQNSTKSQKCLASSTKYQQAGNGPAIVGEHVEISFKSPSPYIGSNKVAGEIVWQTSIHYPNASYIAPFFKSMDLAVGDKLIVRSPDQSRSWTYTGNGPRDLGKQGGFWGIHIHGDTAIIELHSSSNKGAKGVYISRFARGFTLAETTDGIESLCTADDSLEAKCYQISQPEMYNQARAVARLLQNGTSHCTGWLVGDEGHLLTNQHCIADQAQANNITIELMAEGADCATNCASALGCPGIIEATAPTFIKGNGALDYALILPTSTVNDLPVTYGFMQLRESGAVLGEELYIPQHPRGWGKRIAFESTYPVDTTGFGVVASITEPSCGSGGPANVGYWLDTQGGSSGSPVIALDDHKVVALHHCAGGGGCAVGGAGESPNRGIPIQLVITDLGADLPNGATCNTPDAPTSISSSAVGANQISISWTEPVGGSFTYDIYRSLGDCTSSTYTLIASNVAGSSYADTTVSGGSEYAYKIKTFDVAESCNSTFSTCSSSTATGICTLAPTFAGITQASNLNQNNCSIQLDWQTATTNCGTTSVFNIYKSTNPSFIPSVSNLISSCETGASYIDQDIQNAIEYHYIVRAEDDSTNGTGVCAAGNENLNTIVESALVTGPNSTLFTDDLEAGTPGSPLAGWVAEAGPLDTGQAPWGIIDTNANSGTKSFFVSDQPSRKDQIIRLDTVFTPQVGSILEFWHRYDTEASWDGGALEYSTDGGSTWLDILDGNGGSITANTNRFIMHGYDGTLSTSNTPTNNGPLNGRMAWHGDNSTWEQVQVNLDDFAGTAVEFRWLMSCDASVNRDGWYIDDISVFTPTACQSTAVPELMFMDGFE